MESYNTQNRDIYEEKLLQAMTILQQCQINKHLTSCMQCQEILSCPIRSSYVNSVYESMNKGNEGGFDFA